MYKKLQAKNLLCTGCGACVYMCANDAFEYIYYYEIDGSMVAQINSGFPLSIYSAHSSEREAPVISAAQYAKPILFTAFTITGAKQPYE